MEKLFELDKKFKHTRLLTIITLVCFALIAIASTIFTYINVRDFTKRIYVVNKDKQFEAMVADVNHNRGAEIKYQLRRFHELFFTISPDPKAIDANMQRAFYLSDESVKRLYDDMYERNIFRDMIQGNVNQRVHVDSVFVDTSTYPYQAQTLFTISQSRATSNTIRKAISYSTLEDVPRTENSPNGLLIRNYSFKITDTKRSLSDESF